jgi:hypothetical protein
MFKHSIGIVAKLYFFCTAVTSFVLFNKERGVRHIFFGALMGVPYCMVLGGLFLLCPPSDWLGGVLIVSSFIASHLIALLVGFFGGLGIGCGGRAARARSVGVRAWCLRGLVCISCFYSLCIFLCFSTALLASNGQTLAYSPCFVDTANFENIFFIGGGAYFGIKLWACLSAIFFYR